MNNTNLPPGTTTIPEDEDPLDCGCVGVCRCYVEDCWDDLAMEERRKDE